MKKTQVTDALRNIQKRIVSFLSLALIVALGSTGILGTNYIANGLRASAIEFLEETNFKDFELVSAVGISEDDLKKIQEVEDVTDAEGAMVVDGVMNTGKMTLLVYCTSITVRISIPYIREGKIVPDMEVPVSEHRSFKFFEKATVRKYAEQFGWTLITRENMKAIFLRMAETMTMSYS